MTNRMWLRDGPQIPSVLLLMFIAAALVLGGLTLIFTFNAARDVREQVRTSTEMLSDVRAVQRSVTDAETGQRGYLLTGNDIYLEPFFEGQENCGPALDRLEQRLGSEASPEQSQAVARLRTLSNAKFAELAQTIEYARQGNRPAALQLVQTNEGLELMRQIRATIEKLETDEERALAASIAKAEETESNTRLILTFLAVFLVFGDGARPLVGCSDRARRGFDARCDRGSPRKRTRRPARART